MTVKNALKNGALVLLNPKTGAIEDNSDDLGDFSDESINSDEFDSEYASDNSGELSYDEKELKSLSEIWDMDDEENGVETSRSISGPYEEELVELADSEESSDENEKDSDSESESDFGSEDDSGSEADSEEDDRVPEGVFDSDLEAEEAEEAPLNSVISTIEKSRKKEERQRKKLVSLNIQENELAVPVSGPKLSIEEMMGTSNKPSLLKDTKSMAIPLPKRIRERNERTAAYEISKKEVEKWKDDVERIKRAEVVKFPLIDNEPKKKISVFNKSDNPLNELEMKVGGVLEESLLEDTRKEELFEQIQVAKMSKEDMIKRQNELRLMRELLFREEKKAKRIKKIKSKSYRRIKKKELLRNQELIDEIEGIDRKLEDDESRAEARMTLKFKNSSSKWAKDMLKHGMTKDKETRSEMEAMLQRGQDLKQKILGEEEVSDESLDDLEEDSDDSEAKKSVGKTGFMNMAFMKKAEAKKKERNEKEIEKIRLLESGHDIDEFKEVVNKAKVSLNKGRMVFSQDGVKAAKELEEESKKVVEEQEIDESDNLERRLGSFWQKKGKNGDQRNEEKDREEEKEEDENEGENPWLTSTVHKSNKLRVVDENSTQNQKNEHKMKKTKAKSKDKQELQLIENKTTLNLQSDSEDEGISFQQKDLIKEAFAGDNVVKEFEKDKKRVRDEEDDQWVAAEQPGFNSWIGGSASQKKKQKNSVKKKKVAGVKSADKRKDKNLKNVIFNEKVNKKALKYQSSAVPFPYENKEQYERSLRMPIGQEWTSRATFQKMTMPSVITKSGQVIKPLTRKSK